MSEKIWLGKVAQAKRNTEIAEELAARFKAIVAEGKMLRQDALSVVWEATYKMLDIARNDDL